MEKIKYFTILLFILANISAQDINNGDESSPISKPDVPQQAQNIGYLAYLKKKISEYTNPLYRWYYTHKDTINLIIRGGIAAGLAGLYFKYHVDTAKAFYEKKARNKEVEPGLGKPIPIEELLKKTYD